MSDAVNMEGDGTCAVKSSESDPWRNGDGIAPTGASFANCQDDVIPKDDAAPVSKEIIIPDALVKANDKSSKSRIINAYDASNNQGEPDRSPLGNPASSKSQPLDISICSIANSTPSDDVNDSGKRKSTSSDPLIIQNNEHGTIPKKKKIIASSSNTASTTESKSADAPVPKSSVLSRSSLPQPQISSASSKSAAGGANSPKSSKGEVATTKTTQKNSSRSTSDNGSNSGNIGTDEKLLISSSLENNKASISNSLNRPKFEGLSTTRKSPPRTDNRSSQHSGQGTHPDPSKSSPNPTSLLLQQRHAQAKQGLTARTVSSAEKQTMIDLADICKTCLEDHNFMILNTTASSSVSNHYSIDLNGSFLTKELDDHKYDFFNQDSEGNIVLQAKPPMFPEEFPPGLKDLPLAWWGVIDPKAGKGKYGLSEVVPVTNTKANDTTTKKKNTESAITSKRATNKGRGEKREENASSSSQRRSTNGPPPPPNWGGGGDGQMRGQSGGGGGWGPHPQGHPPRRGDGPPPHFWNAPPHDGPPPPFWNGPPPPHQDGQFPMPPHHWNDYGPPPPWNGPPGNGAPRHRNGPPQAAPPQGSGGRQEQTKIQQVGRPSSGAGRNTQSSRRR